MIIIILLQILIMYHVLDRFNTPRVVVLAVVVAVAPAVVVVVVVVSAKL